MALLTALLAFIGRQLSTVVQAILGWSVTALFGRLSSLKQTALSVALLVSLLWPIAVVGIVFPAVSAWAFAFLPLQKWLGSEVVRWATVFLAVALPLGVGGITRWVAPVPNGTVWRSLLASYPLTLGYAASCVITAVTVPVIKLISIMRGWHDEHVFVQPRHGEYEASLGELVRACDAAGAHVWVEPVPPHMRLAATVLKTMARGSVAAIVSSDPKMVRGDGLELYLYPADLLLRGKPAIVARTRAAMTRTWLERYAFTVSDPPAQSLQTRLQEAWAKLQKCERAPDDKKRIEQRLRNFSEELNHATVPFDQWVILDRSLHRLERMTCRTPSVLDDDLAAQDVASGAVKTMTIPHATDRQRTLAGVQPTATQDLRPLATETHASPVATEPHAAIATETHASPVATEPHAAATPEPRAATATETHGAVATEAHTLPVAPEPLSPLAPIEATPTAAAAVPVPVARSGVGAAPVDMAYLAAAQRAAQDKPLDAPTHGHESPAQLVRRAIEDARELARLEVSLAKDELGKQVVQGTASTGALVASGSLALVAVTMFLFAIASTVVRAGWAALIVGVLALLAAVIIAAVAWRMLPRTALGETRERLDSDVKRLKERVV